MDKIIEFIRKTVATTPICNPSESSFDKVNSMTDMIQAFLSIKAKYVSDDIPEPLELMLCRHLLQNEGYDLTIGQLESVWDEYSASVMASYLCGILDMERSLPKIKLFSYAILPYFKSDDLCYEFSMVDKDGIQTNIDFLPVMPKGYYPSTYNYLRLIQFKLNTKHSIDLSISDLNKYIVLGAAQVEISAKYNSDDEKEDN